MIRNEIIVAVISFITRLSRPQVNTVFAYAPKPRSPFDQPRNKSLLQTPIKLLAYLGTGLQLWQMLLLVLFKDELAQVNQSIVGPGNVSLGLRLATWPGMKRHDTPLAHRLPRVVGLLGLDVNTT